MVEDAEAEYDVELAMPLAAEVAHVAEAEVDLEVEDPRGKPRLLEIRLPALDRNHLRASARELEGVHPFETGKVEDTRALDAIAEHVRDDLDDAPKLHLVAGGLRRDRPDSVREPDVVCGPGAEAPLDLGFLLLDRPDVPHLPPTSFP